MPHGNMATESLVPTGEETQNQPPESTETPEVVVPETAEAEKPEEKPQEEDETQRAIKRLQRRIDKRTSDFYRTQAENETLRAELEKLKAGQTEEKPHQEPDVERLTDEKAEAKLFARTAESIVESGKKLDPAFMESLQDLAAEVGPFVQKNGLPSPFMKAVLDVADNPTKLLHHLGKNPDIAADLADLPVTKLAARLDRIERGLSEPTPKQSSAPKPLEPIKPSASVQKDPSQMTDLEFAKWRKDQIAKRG